METFVLVLLGFFVLACLWHGFVVCPYDVERVELNLPFPDLPAPLEGRTLVFFADLHLSRPGFLLLWLKGELERLRPDLLCISGDLVDGPEGVAPALGFIETLPEIPLGVWFVPGNNERREIDAGDFLTQLARRGVRVLVNDGVAGDESGAWLMAGVDDPSRERDAIDLALGEEPVPFRILLSHSPEPFHQAVRRGVDLVLAGHTHGGQVRFPWAGALWTDTTRTGTRFQYGMYRQGGTTMLLTKGIGMSKLPIRVLCRPELIVAKLRRGRPSAAPSSGAWPSRR